MKNWSCWSLIKLKASIKFKNKKNFQFFSFFLQNSTKKFGEFFRRFDCGNRWSRFDCIRIRSVFRVGELRQSVTESLQCLGSVLRVVVQFVVHFVFGLRNKKRKTVVCFDPFGLSSTEFFGQNKWISRCKTLKVSELLST